MSWSHGRVAIAVLAAGVLVPAFLAAEAATRGAAAAPAETNRVPNASVEADPSSDYYTYGTARFSWERYEGHSGTSSLKISSTQAPGALARWMTRTTRIAVTPGRTYVVAGWLKTSNLAGAAHLSATYWTGDVAYTGDTIDSQNLSGTHEWARLGFETIAPARAAYLRIEVRQFGPGSTWADDFVVADTAPSTGPPELLEPPVISGPTLGPTGYTFDVTEGSWRNTPTAFRYQWRRCVYDVDYCADVEGATSSSYSVGWVMGYGGVRVVVTASNAYGDTSADIPVGRYSYGGTPVYATVASAPGIVDADDGHTIGIGSPTVGERLAVTTGAVTGLAPPMTPNSLGWSCLLRCDASGRDCLQVATGSYTVTAADRGSRLRVAAFWANGVGETQLQVMSELTGEVR